MKGMQTLIFGATVLLACVQTVNSVFAEPLTDKEQIAAIRALSNQAIASHDAAGVVSSLDSNYQITTGKGDLFHDTPAEEMKLWAEVFSSAEDIVYVRTPDVIEISTYLPRAAEHGTWIGSWTTAAGRREEGGSYTASWRKAGGEWKIRSEVFVTLFCNGPGC